MSVDFSHRTASPLCDDCGEYLSACRCKLDNELLRDGPAWLTGSNEIPDGFHLWDGDRPRALGGARHTDLPGIIREAIRHIDDPDQYCEVIAWLESIGYLDALED